MAERMLTVVARVKAKADRADEVREMLMSLVAPTLQEPGCIDYVPHQSSDDPSLFLFFENWRSRADLDEHLQKPHIQAFVAQAGDLLAEPLEVTFWGRLAP